MKMKKRNILLFLIMMVLSVAKSSAQVYDGEKTGKVKSQTLYVFGVATCFNDSLAFITEICQMDSMPVNKKTKFLPNRTDYSYQLKSYLEDILGLEHRTCAVFFSPKKKKIIKWHNKMINRLKNTDGNVLHTLDKSSFVFKRMNY